MRVVSLSLLLLAAVLVAPVPSFAKEKKLSPIGDYNKLNKQMRRASDEEKIEAAEAYLAKWKATGRKATGTTRYGLAQFEQMAGQFKAAFEGFRSVRKDDEVKAKSRDYASTAEANLLLAFPALRNELGAEAIDKATADLAKYADNMGGDDRKKSRGKLRGLLAMLHAAAGRLKESTDVRLKILSEDPKSVKTHAQPIMQGLLGATHKLDGYDALRKQAASILKTITDTQKTVVGLAKGKMNKAKGQLSPEALDADGNLKQTEKKKMTKAERAYGGAKISYDGAVRLLESLAPYEKPFALLGKPAAAWTVEKAYAEDVSSLEDLKGKVVLLDFWNTWGEACSFPVIRDLLRDYGEKGLAVVGVTASARVVYAERFDLDEDHRSKASGKKFFAARLATENTPADGQYTLEDAEYRAREIEAIGAFIESHEMKWPVVMIDKTEPAPNYGQATWPHTVILDKQGRIRYIRGGALSRDKTGAVAALKTVIEDLLAEK